MANKRTKKNIRVFKKNSKFKRKIPRWSIFVVIGVAAVGVFVIFNTFAASNSTVNTATIISGGAVSNGNSVSSMARSPITLEACRMSDTPGEGPQNRVYVGAKPVISSYVADKLNAVWDKYYPEYHIDGQNVTYAADYQMPQSVYYEANYIYDRDKPTDTSSQYSDFLLPSEGYPKFYSGELWETFAPGQPPALNVSRMEAPGPALKKIWDNGTVYGNKAQYIDTPSGGSNKPTSPFPASSSISPTEKSSSASSNGASTTNQSSSTSNTSNNSSGTRFKPSGTQSSSTSSTNKSTNTPNTSNRNTSQTNTTSTNRNTPSDVSKLNSILGTVTSKTNPNLGLYPGALPGRTSWSSLEGPVAKYNDARCKASQPGNSDPYGCGNDPSKYDPINNPNPFIKFDVSWKGGRTSNTVNENGKQLVDHDVKIVRFKDLPKCGADPIQARNEIDAKANFSQVMYDNYERAFNQIKAAGIDVGVAGPGQDKMAEIFLKNGISPLASLGSPYWTGLPPQNAPTTGIPGYGEGRIAEPYPY